jgi:hypothetical protein
MVAQAAPVRDAFYRSIWDLYAKNNMIGRVTDSSVARDFLLTRLLPVV